MNCRKIRHYLSQYYRGELTKKEEETVSRHIEVCAECAREAQVYKALNHAVQNLEELKPSADFERKLEGKIGGLLYTPAEIKNKPLVTIFPSLKWALIPVATLALFLLFKGGLHKSKTDFTPEGTGLARIDAPIEESREDTLPVEKFPPNVNVQKEAPVNFVKVGGEKQRAFFVMDNLRHSDLQRLPDSRVINNRLNNYVMNSVSYRPVDDKQINEAYVLPAVATISARKDKSY
ncbi:MAG: zf-HC2 domain-containing protein [candidate division Zixibacteria bacterium]|nr:zf-HC2 domain-containing protein [candidate division Zixibacteria bacterium]